MSDFFLLALFQLFWASSYTAMKLALGEMPLGLVLIFRYGMAALVLWPLALRSGGGWRFSIRDAAIIVLVGVLDFALSPFLQLRAVQLTFTSDVAVLVAFEPMLTALLAVMVLRERLARPTLVAFAVATLGMLLMSDLAFTTDGLSGGLRLYGNVLFLLSLCCEALYSVSSRFLSQQHSPYRLSCLMMSAGAVANLLAHHDALTHAQVAAIGPTGWGMVLFLALGCSALGYAGWCVLLRRMPVNQITLSLFLQPIFGGLVSYVVLREVPSVRTFSGAALIFATLLAWLLWHLRSRRNERIYATETARRAKSGC
ncbi:MAG: DMT family transporter [Deltaproteobacteria bacterium]|nr:DMT family transporter [Deltaproteobacteria bacterium]